MRLVRIQWHISDHSANASKAVQTPWGKRQQKPRDDLLGLSRDLASGSVRMRVKVEFLVEKAGGGDFLALRRLGEY